MATGEGGREGIGHEAYGMRQPEYGIAAKMLKRESEPRASDLGPAENVEE